MLPDHTWDGGCSAGWSWPGSARPRLGRITAGRGRKASRQPLTGTIREIYIGFPHPTLRLQAAEGMWTVELGNPRQTAAAGFSAEAARVGETLTALGNRARDTSERRLKAVRVTVRERTYDIYPDRIRSS